MRAWECLAVAFAAAAGVASAEPAAHLQLWSSPGDYVGQGQTWDLRYAAGDPFQAQILAQTHGVASYLRFQLHDAVDGSADSAFNFDVATTATRHGLEAGPYLRAERAAFASPGHPGLDAAFQHRGCNTIAGAFVVQDLTYSTTTWQLETFTVVFKQSCDGMPPLYGFFSYDAGGQPRSATRAQLAALLRPSVFGGEP